MDKDAEIKRLNEKIEFLARTNMLYSDWEHRETQVTSDLIRKGIEEHKINAELRAEIERLKQREWVGLTDEEYQNIRHGSDESGPYVSYTSYDEGDGYEEIEIHVDDFARAIEAKLREKNGG